jgi:hypothetical protein
VRARARLRGAAPLVLAVLLGASPSARAASGPATAEEVLAAARAVNAPVHDKVSRVAMRIVAPGGEERVRTLRGFEKRTAGGRKLLWLFESPADLAGTAFLAWQQRPDPDEMWLYFPAQRRVRHVSPELRRERFQGSTFTYEDLTTVFYLDFEGTHTLVESEPCGERRCFVIDSVLPPRRSVYDRVRSWIRADDHLPSRIELEGVGVHKVMRVRRVAEVGGIPTILEAEMETPDDGYRTTVEFSDVAYNTDLGDEIFTVGHLSQEGK